MNNYLLFGCNSGGQYTICARSVRRSAALAANADYQLQQSSDCTRHFVLVFIDNGARDASQVRRLQFGDAGHCAVAQVEHMR